MLVPILDSSKDGCMEEGDKELRITTTEHVQLSEQPLHILARLSLHPFVQADDLKSIVGPYSPRRQGGERSESLQEKFPVGMGQAEDVDGKSICSPAISPVPTHTIAWSECVSCAIESPTCIAHHGWQRGLGKHSVEAVIEEGQAKTIVDGLLETDKATYTHGACPADFACSCQCSQLPNQILAMLDLSCTI
ncbi:unnamed protein product [Calypogeia fissa]